MNVVGVLFCQYLANFCTTLLYISFLEHYPHKALCFWVVCSNVKVEDSLRRINTFIKFAPTSVSRCVIYYLQLVLTNHFQYNSISQSYIICRFENQVLLISNDSEIFGIIRSLCKNVGYTLCLVYIIASVPQAESNTNTSKLIEAPGWSLILRKKPSGVDIWGYVTHVFYYFCLLHASRVTACV